MLINDSLERPANVKFVSYTGKWPSLCRGILTLEILGRAVTFGDQDRFAPKLPSGRAPDLPRFWSTGGRCGYRPDEIETGEWNTDVSLLPEEYGPFAEEIDRVLNENVEHGCCGGCR